MEFSISTKGFTDIVDISRRVEKCVSDSGISGGVAHVFVQGSTAAISVIEFEPGAVRDLKEALERIAPMDGHYHHNEAWGDGNGFAHLRAALMKPSLSVPVSGGRLLTGTWQQIVLLDFDNRPRRRTIHVRITPTV